MKRTIVITGGSSGLGLETARLLAGDKDNLLLLGSPDALNAQAAGKLQSAAGSVRWLELDLGSFASIRRFAAAVIRLSPGIDVLACNAGIQVAQGTQTTAEGFEKTFGVNYLGHFLLTRLLLPCINNAKGRIVLVSSGTHFKPAIWQSAMFGIPPAHYLGCKALASAESFAEYPAKSRGYVRYATSKLCMLMFGYSLARKLRQGGQGITVNVFDPGLMPGTGLARSEAPLKYWAWKHLMPVMRLFKGVYGVKTSAKNLRRLLTAPVFNNISGQYIEGRSEKASSTDSYDTGLWEDLWSGSEALTGVPFHIA